MMNRYPFPLRGAPSTTTESSIDTYTSRPCERPTFHPTNSGDAFVAVGRRVWVFAVTARAETCWRISPALANPSLIRRSWMKYRSDCRYRNHHANTTTPTVTSTTRRVMSAARTPVTEGVQPAG
ncbi:MAG: hypothetical protein ACTHJI_02155 [Leifsonia sp.]